MQNRTAGQSWLNSNSHIGSKNVCKIVHYSQQRLWEYQLISQSGLCVAFGFGWTWKYSLQTYRMAHSKWKETKQQASLLPGPAEPGCNLVSFYFLWAILCTQAVLINLAGETLCLKPKRRRSYPAIENETSRRVVRQITGEKSDSVRGAEMALFMNRPQIVEK